MPENGYSLSGEIISQGNPSQLIDSIDGKIWSKIIHKKDLEDHKKAFKVISTKLVAGETQINVLSDKLPDENFKSVSPNLEDYYFAVQFTHHQNV